MNDIKHQDGKKSRIQPRATEFVSINVTKEKTEYVKIEESKIFVMVVL